MKKWFFVILGIGFWNPAFSGEFDARKEIIAWMEKAGMQTWLEAPVEITQTAAGTPAIRDVRISANSPAAGIMRPSQADTPAGMKRKKT